MKISCYISAKWTFTVKGPTSINGEPAILSIFTATLYDIKGSDNTLDLAKILKRRSIALKILGAFCATSSHGSYNAIHLFCMLRSYLHIMPFVIPPTSSLGSRLSAYKPCWYNILQAYFWARMRFTSGEQVTGHSITSHYHVATDQLSDQLRLRNSCATRISRGAPGSWCSPLGTAKQTDEA